MLPYRRRAPKPPRFYGDLPVFRARYRELFGSEPDEDRGGYFFWLRNVGVDPQTGAMTAEGFRFYHQLLTEQAAKRGSRRDPRRSKGRVLDPR